MRLKDLVPSRRNASQFGQASDLHFIDIESGTEDAAALKVLRRYLTREDEPVLLTVSIHPADRFSINTTLTRS